ncbi:hypothetical protein D3C85_1939730 [compost metagenome]
MSYSGESSMLVSLFSLPRNWNGITFHGWPRPFRGVKGAMTMAVSLLLSSQTSCV